MTEGGYFIDPATGAFDPAHPELVADAANPHRTAFGAIIAALRARRSAGTPPFTVMSCDNLPGNGHVTQAAVTGLARLSDPAFADWIGANVAFPNGMVDRITPATGPRERALAAEFGLNDPVPVTCEPFRQWVVEDNFPAGRPALEKVGVTFTPHVHAYEMMTSIHAPTNTSAIACCAICAITWRTAIRRHRPKFRKRWPARYS